MENKRRLLYMQWIQGERIDVLVGAEEEIFIVARDLVYWRSDFFRKALDWQDENVEEKPIKLPDTSGDIFQDFFNWIHAERPCIDTTSTLERLVELAIFAEIHLITSLKNQALDVLRERLVQHGQKLRPHLVARIYDAVPSHSRLRELIRMVMGVIKDSDVFVDYDEQIKHWSPVFEAHAEPGRGFL